MGDSGSASASAAHDEDRIVAFHLQELKDIIASSLNRDQFNSACVPLYGLDQLWSALQAPVSIIIKEQLRLKVRLLKRDLADELTRNAAPPARLI
jgi:hypothetical protein